MGAFMLPGSHQSCIITPFPQQGLPSLPVVAHSEHSSPGPTFGDALARRFGVSPDQQQSDITSLFFFPFPNPQIFSPLSSPISARGAARGGWHGAWCCASSIAVGPSLGSFLAPWCRGTWTRAAQPLSLAQRRHVMVLGLCVATSSPGKPPRFKRIALKKINKSQLALRKKAPKPAHGFRLQLAFGQLQKGSRAERTRRRGASGELEHLGVVLAPTRAFNRL